MTPDAAILSADVNARPADVRPQFVDDAFNGDGDWWLDLGGVDLPA